MAVISGRWKERKKGGKEERAEVAEKINSDPHWGMVGVTKDMNRASRISDVRITTGKEWADEKEAR